MLYILIISVLLLNGFGYFLYRYFNFKILLYIIGPIVIGFIFFCNYWKYSRKAEETKRSK